MLGLTVFKLQYSLFFAVLERMLSCYQYSCCALWFSCCPQQHLLQTPIISPKLSCPSANKYRYNAALYKPNSTQMVNFVPPLHTQNIPLPISTFEIFTSCKA